MIEMPKPKSQVRQVIELSLELYLIFVAICSVISIFLYFKDIYSSNPKPVYWFYPTFAFALPFLGVAIVWIFFVRDTKYRVSDPYRFSLRQYRYFTIPSEKISEINVILTSLGYTILKNSTNSEAISLNALRVRPTHPERFYEKRHMFPHQISVFAKMESGLWKVTIEGDLWGFALADFKNIIYDSLEELVETLNWKQFQNQ